MNCEISGKFIFGGEEFRNAKYEGLVHFFKEVMDINVLTRSEIEDNMKLAEVEEKDWFDNDYDLVLFKNNKNIILVDGIKETYMIADNGLDNSLIEYIKNSKEFKNTFEELVINNERVI